MKGPKLLVVLGTRPEVIKLAPVILSLGERLGRGAMHLCATAQHRGMLDQMMGTFGLRADSDLDVMREGQTSMYVLREILAGLEPVLLKVKPDMLIVQGDTTTALAGALAAFHHKIPVAHVEAGLRSADLGNPFPEEGNRVLVSRLAALHFAPTATARENLLREDIPASRVFVTGNPVVDALQWALRQPVSRNVDPFRGKPYLLVTMHRRESFGRPIREIFASFRELVERDPELRICYPVHPNPHVRLWAHKLLRHQRIVLAEPTPYVDFVHLMRGARLILTDSGGITEEASSLSKPAVILREVTERPELVKLGGAVLSGTRTSGIVRATRRILNDPAVYRRMSQVANPYGDGRAARRIADIILRRLGRPDGGRRKSYNLFQNI